MHFRETDSDHKLPTNLIERQGLCPSSPSHDACNIEYLLYITKNDLQEPEINPESVVESSHNTLDKE